MMAGAIAPKTHEAQVRKTLVGFVRGTIELPMGQRPYNSGITSNVLNMNVLSIPGLPSENPPLTQVGGEVTLRWHFTVASQKPKSNAWDYKEHTGEASLEPEANKTNIYVVSFLEGAVKIEPKRAY